MGTLAGHLLPGTFFILFSIWWSFVTSIRHIQSSMYKKNSKIGYKSTSAMPCFCLPCHKFRQAPLESYIKFTFSILGILGEFITGLKFNHEMTQGIGIDDIARYGCDKTHSNHEHKREITSKIQSVFFEPANSQHITMYSAFLLQSVVEILIYKKYGLPKRLEYYFALMAYGVEAFLFAFHLHSRAPMDVHLHVLLVYAIVGCCISVCLEIYNPDQVVYTYARILFNMLQGTWFWQTGFILYPPWDIAILKWDRCDHNQIMTITMSFCWHVILILSGLLIQFGLLKKVYMSSKMIRDRFDEIIVLDEGMCSDRLNVDNSYGDTRFLMLNSEDEDVFEDKNEITSSLASSTTSGNYSKMSELSSSKV